MDYKDLGVRIRVLRKSRRITQEKLAELIGYSCSYIGHIERGTRKPSIDVLVAIATAFSCSLDELLDIEKTPITSRERLVMLLEEALRIASS